MVMAWLESRGHGDYDIEYQRRGVVGTCKCGYRCAGRATPEQAVQAIWHHLMKDVMEARNSGVSLPRVVAPSS